MRIEIERISINEFVLTMEEDEENILSSFSSREIAHCEGKAFPERHLAARFIAKEALFRVLNPDPTAIKHEDIEIINDSMGIPRVKFPEGYAVSDNIHLSFSHTRSSVVVLVVLDGDGQGANLVS